MILKVWRASRPYSYPAALVPVGIGAAFSKWIWPDQVIHWGDFLLTVIGCIFAQAISNLVNDLADFKFGVDRADVPGRHSALLTGELTFRQMLKATLLVCALAAFIGIYFSLKIGWPMMALVAFGALISVEYTAPPLRLKYHGLGDLGVFLCFGLGMSFGSYMVQASANPGWLDANRLGPLLAYSMPSALLVVAILQTNNHRDREKDSHQGGKTVANALPLRTSEAYLVGLVLIPYGIVVGLVVAGIASWPVLIVFGSAPIAYALIQQLKAGEWKGIVPRAAQLDGAFGFLLVLGMVAEIFARGRR